MYICIYKYIYIYIINQYCYGDNLGGLRLQRATTAEAPESPRWYHLISSGQQKVQRT